MGLGPSIKMTTLHHFRCPVTAALSNDPDIEFGGILVDGVSEGCDEKEYTAARVGDLAQLMRVDGAIVAIDGWGNHHIDFVDVIEQLGIRGIPAVGLSYFGLQGRLVCTNQYVDCVIDFNKSASGYESCVVGQNNLDDYDAMKALALIKNRLKKIGKPVEHRESEIIKLRRLQRKVYPIKSVVWGEKTTISRGILTLRKGIEDRVLENGRISKVTVNILSPEEKTVHINSNLDFSPVACKVRGVLGEGITHLLEGVTVMLNGVEDKSGFQPCNIGSSDGILNEQVTFDKAGTPASTDYIIHIDFLFNEGEGRTAQGIQAAHKGADMIVQEIRNVMKTELVGQPCKQEEFFDVAKPGKRKIILVKITSGLGNMYDSAMFPTEPGGFIGSHNMRDSRNIPYAITPNQCRDGAIHTLL